MIDLPAAADPFWDAGVKRKLWGWYPAITSVHSAKAEAMVLLRLCPQARQATTEDVNYWGDVADQSQYDIRQYLLAGEQTHGGLMTGGGSPVAGGTYSNWPDEYRRDVWPLHRKYNVASAIARALKHIVRYYKHNRVK